MNPKVKKLYTNARILILAAFLIFSYITISPHFDSEGVAIRSVVFNSSADIAGIENPKPNTPPMSREVIIAINNIPIKTVGDYEKFVSSLTVNRTFSIRTKTKTSIFSSKYWNYRLKTKPKYKVTVLNETEEKIVPEEYKLNITINGTVKEITKVRNKTVRVPKVLREVVGVEDIGLKVYPAPTTNIRKGLDLSGGTRVVLQPEEKIDDATFDILIANMKQRLNIYGLSDIIVKEADDLSGNKYVVVEIAGTNEEEVKDLISKQGKFEAKVGNFTVFRGGDRDITYVCRSADCSGIDPYRRCGILEDGTYVCSFRFGISLRPEAAERQAEATRRLKVLRTDETGKILPKEDQYLNESLYLYLDDKLVDSLKIGASLKGRAETEIRISGSGVGNTEQAAVVNALENMKRLQTIMITGSLPVKLKIVKTDSLSPVLGEEFIKNALVVALAAILAVAAVISIRFRKVSISIPVIITMMSEIILLLGFAALVGWNLDLAAIAGILIAVGTGVDDQIVITDETLRGERKTYMNWKQRIKNAFFIIMASYFTTLVAMIPLWSAGAGLLKGFAFTTIIGISFGVFITRPAFAAMIEIFLKDKN